MPDWRNRVEQSLPSLFVIVGLLLIILTLFLPGWFFHQEAPVREIGVLLVIAGLATIAVERRRIKEYTDALTQITADKVDEIRTASIRRILLGLLPEQSEQFLALVSEAILDQKFFRQNQKIDFTLDWYDDQEEYIKTFVVYDYKVINRRQSTETFKILVAESLEMEEAFPGETIIRSLKAKYEGAMDWLVNLVDYQVKSPDGFYVLFEKEVPLKAGQSLLITSQTERVERSRGEEPVFFTSSSNGFEATVHFPEELEVSVEPVHPWSPEGLQPDSDTTVAGRRRLAFSFNSPMLPYWCVIFYWRPKRPEEEAARPQA